MDRGVWGYPNGGRRRQVNLLPLPGHDAYADLLWSFLLLGHLIAVKELFQARGAVTAMFDLKAAMQALVSVAPITVAEARLLIDDLGDFSSQFIGVHLHRPHFALGEVQLRRREDRRNIVAFLKTRIVICRHVGSSSQPLGWAGDDCSKGNAEHREQSFHNSFYLDADIVLPLEAKLRLSERYCSQPLASF